MCQGKEEGVERKGGRGERVEEGEGEGEGKREGEGRKRRWEKGSVISNSEIACLHLSFKGLLSV